MFHILQPSLWPFFLAFGAFNLVTGIAFAVHYVVTGYYILLLGICMIAVTSVFWFLDISREAVIKGDHTRVVRRGLKIGFIFFIASEVMLFFGFF